MVCCCYPMFLFVVSLFRQHYYVLIFQQISTQRIQGFDNSFNIRYLHVTNGRLYNFRNFRSFGPWNKFGRYWVGGKGWRRACIRFLSWYYLLIIIDSIRIFQLIIFLHRRNCQVPLATSSKVFFNMRQNIVILKTNNCCRCSRSYFSSCYSS